MPDDKGAGKSTLGKRFLFAADGFTVSPDRETCVAIISNRVKLRITKFRKIFDACESGEDVKRMLASLLAANPQIEQTLKEIEPDSFVELEIELERCETK